jgi:glycosyltransferase involved in cell wall biosynthesis
MTTVDLLLGVGYDPDPRVRRETQALARHRFQIRVLAWDRDGTRAPTERDGEVLIRRVHVKSRWSRGMVQGIFLAALAVRYLRLVRQRRPDVLHAVDLPMLTIALLIAPFAGRPRIVYEAFEIYGVMVSHRMPSPAVRFIQFLEQRLPRRADLVITPGEIRQEYFAQRGIDSVCIPNWIETPQDLPPRDGARAELGIEADRFVVLYAGSLHASRDVDGLLRHAARCPEDLILVAGQGDDEERLRNLSSTIPNVRFLGWLPNPAAVLSAADAIYYSLRADHPYGPLAAPNTLYQAIAYALPLVYRRQGELEIVARRHVIGAAFDDDESLDVALDTLRDRARNAEIRAELRSLRGRYAWSVAVERLVAAYPMKGTAASAASTNGP